MHNFKELLVWQKSMNLATGIYKVTESVLPNSEKYNLVSQMQRAVVSIASNISEGCGRGSNAMLKQFLSIAAGSACELETQIILSSRLRYIDDEVSGSLINKVTEIQKMLFVFIRRLES